MKFSYRGLEIVDATCFVSLFVRSILFVSFFFQVCIHFWSAIRMLAFFICVSAPQLTISLFHDKGKTERGRSRKWSLNFRWRTIHGGHLGSDDRVEKKKSDSSTTQRTRSERHSSAAGTWRDTFFHYEDGNCWRNNPNHSIACTDLCLSIEL